MLRTGLEMTGGDRNGWASVTTRPFLLPLSTKVVVICEMQEKFELTAFFRAMAAWETHKSEWLKKLKDARQPSPTKEQIEGYRNVWTEGWLECYAEIQTSSTESSRAPE